MGGCLSSEIWVLVFSTEKLFMERGRVIVNGLVGHGTNIKSNGTNSCHGMPNGRLLLSIIVISMYILCPTCACCRDCVLKPYDGDWPWLLSCTARSRGQHVCCMFALRHPLFFWSRQARILTIWAISSPRGLHNARKRGGRLAQPAVAGNLRALFLLCSLRGSNKPFLFHMIQPASGFA